MSALENIEVYAVAAAPDADEMPWADKGESSHANARQAKDRNAKTKDSRLFCILEILQASASMTALGDLACGLVFHFLVHFLVNAVIQGLHVIRQKRRIDIQ